MDGKLKKIAAEILEFLKDYDDYLITSHYSPDGDNIGASTAFYILLKEMGKKVVFINRDKYPDKYNFIKPENMKFFNKNDFKTGKKFKNVITIDTADYHRIGDVSELIDEDAFIINIDHHYTNTMYGDLNFVISDLASACEVLYMLLKENSLKIDKEIASCLYAGMLSDTGGFRFKNTGTDELRIGTELSEYGIDLSYLMKKVFFSKQYEDVIRYSRITSNIKLYKEVKLGYLYHDELAEPIPEHDPVMEAMDTVEESEVNLYVRKIEENKLRISLRSKTDFSAADFVKKYGGGGHKMSAGMFYEGDLEDFENSVLCDLKKELK